MSITETNYAPITIPESPEVRGYADAKKVQDRTTAALIGGALLAEFAERTVLSQPVITPEFSTHSAAFLPARANFVAPTSVVKGIASQAITLEQSQGIQGKTEAVVSGVAKDESIDEELQVEEASSQNKEVGTVLPDINPSIDGSYTELAETGALYVKELSIAGGAFVLGGIALVALSRMPAGAPSRVAKRISAWVSANRRSSQPLHRPSVAVS